MCTATVTFVTTKAPIIPKVSVGITLSPLDGSSCLTRQLLQFEQPLRRDKISECVYWGFFEREIQSRVPILSAHAQGRTFHFLLDLWNPLTNAPNLEILTLQPPSVGSRVSRNLDSASSDFRQCIFLGSLPGKDAGKTAQGAKRRDGFQEEGR